MKTKQNIISHDMYGAIFFVSMTYIAFIEQTALRLDVCIRA